jgi:hypothetical protein
MNTIKTAIINLLANVSVTFANVEYTTSVVLAAKNKHLAVKKHTSANVMLFSNIKALDLYKRSVERSIERLNDTVIDFKTSESSFTHDADCFSIVTNKKDTTKQYLFCVFNNNVKSHSYYTLNDIIIEKNAVATFMTASASKALLSDKSVVYSALNDCTHDVIVRTISLANITKIKAMKQVLELA